MANPSKIQFDYELSIPIKAGREVLWRILSDVENYPTWNSVVTKARGELKEGNSIKLALRFQQGKPKPATCQVKKIQAQDYFLLTQTLIGTGFLHMEHYFILEEKEPGTVLFRQKWEMYGLLAKLMKKPLSGSLAAFERMNMELKALAEQLETTAPAEV